MYVEMWLTSLPLEISFDVEWKTHFQPCTWIFSWKLHLMFYRFFLPLTKLMTETATSCCPPHPPLLPLPSFPSSSLTLMPAVRLSIFPLHVPVFVFFSNLFIQSSPFIPYVLTVPIFVIHLFLWIFNRGLMLSFLILPDKVEGMRKIVRFMKILWFVRLLFVPHWFPWKPPPPTSCCREML